MVSALVMAQLEELGRSEVIAGSLSRGSGIVVTESLGQSLALANACRERGLVVRQPALRALATGAVEVRLGEQEPLDREVLDAGVRLAESADLVLAIGTSLTVHPVAGLVPYAFGHSARVVIVNAQETPYDHLADAVLRDPIEEVLPRLAASG